MNLPLLESEVKLPRNVDDAELAPEMRALPADGTGVTAMTMTLISIVLAQTTHRLAAMAMSPSTSTQGSGEAARRGVMAETQRRVEEWLARCNAQVPQQRLTRLCARFQLRKLDFVTRLQWGILRRDGAHVDAEFVAEEGNLVEAVEILGSRRYFDDAMLAQFAWIKRAYPQYHVTMYILWHLSVKPEGPNVERAWEAAEMLFRDEVLDDTSTGFGSMSAVLRALRAKAVAARENARSRNSRGENNGVTHGNMGGDLSRGEEPCTNILGGTDGGGGFGLEGGCTDEWLSWTALVQGFQLDSYDGYW